MRRPTSSGRSNDSAMTKQLLFIECEDRPGLVHGVTGVLFRHNCNVISNHEFVDHESARFFMRTEFTGVIDAAMIEAEARAVLPPAAFVRMSMLTARRVVVLCSREHHCVADLLTRHAFDEMNASLRAVISNAEELGGFVAKFNLPFHWVPNAGLSREVHEERLLDIIQRYEPEYLVLAKYMRVLTPQFVAHFPNRIINIHHSFLPAFAGAKPYQQAFQRGVKVIGATAHFVTADLDQGPIIAQETLSVDHTHGPQDLAQAGRDVEKLALSRALRLVFEDRVFLCRNRTVIFD
jgi:formyltetrahydrofolate deformylase